MNIFRKVRRMVMKNQNTTLSEWKRRLEEAKSKYSDERGKMLTYRKYYKGTREIQKNVNSSITNVKKASNVRNIVYELVESQVDSSIPMPKVRAIHQEDEALAVKIEKLLENMVINLKLQVLNDSMERVTYVQGGSLFHVQWDTNKGLHSEVGAVVVDKIHPYKVIPQPGVTELNDMDYFFVQDVMTKKAVKRFYGVDVEDAENDEQEIGTSGEINYNVGYVKTQSEPSGGLLTDMSGMKTTQLVNMCGVMSLNCKTLRIIRHARERYVLIAAQP